jgi:[phosphatase 2A protein]-leucine-carboxy methyltransferase
MDLKVDNFFKDEIHRVERLERLDEKELMQQLFEHYCVTLGWRNGADINLDEVDWW